MHATALVDVTDWEEKPYNEVEGEPKLTRAVVKQTYQGDIAGEGSLEYLMVYTDISVTYVGLERVIGSIADRRGSFTLKLTGVYEDGEAKTTCSVVPGSGTGDLVGLVGTGKVSAGEGRTFPFALDYDFE
jgi:hypothetical protein